MLLLSYLTSEHFSSLKINTLSKLSGRYWLNDNFSWDTMPVDKFCGNFLTRLINTRYYRVPKDEIEYFVARLKVYSESPEFRAHHPDIENCFFLFRIFKLENLYSPPKLGVSGHLGPRGNYVED